MRKQLQIIKMFAQVIADYNQQFLGLQLCISNTCVIIIIIIINQSILVSSLAFSRNCNDLNIDFVCYWVAI